MGLGTPVPAHPPLSKLVLAQQTQCFEMSCLESQFLLQTPTHLCTKSRDWRAYTLPWLIFGCNGQGEEEEGQREDPSLFWWKRLHSWLPSYPLAAHLLHLICSNFTELGWFRNPLQLHASLRPAAELIFGLSRCPVFHRDPKCNTLFYWYIFIRKGEITLKKKNLERKRYLNSLIMEPEEEVLDYALL